MQLPPCGRGFCQKTPSSGKISPVNYGICCKKPPDLPAAFGGIRFPRGRRILPGIWRSVRRRRSAAAEEDHALEQIPCIGFLLMKCAQPWLQLHDRSDFLFFNLIFGAFLTFSKGSLFCTQDAAKNPFFQNYPKSTAFAPILVFLSKFLFVFLSIFLIGPNCQSRGFYGIISLAKFSSTRGESVPWAHKVQKIYHIGGIHYAYAHGFPLVRRGQ